MRLLRTKCGFRRCRAEAAEFNATARGSQHGERNQPKDGTLGTSFVLQVGFPRRLALRKRRYHCRTYAPHHRAAPN
jgi:hypothetical protein